MTKWQVTITEPAYITRTIEAETDTEATSKLEDMLGSGEVSFEDYGTRSIECEAIGRTAK